MLHEVAHGLHDLRDARLVIRPQQRRAVSGDEGVADELAQLGELTWVEHRPLSERDDLSAVVLDDLGLHLASRAVGAGVYVCDEPQRRGCLMARARRDACHDIAPLLEAYLRHAELDQLVSEEAQQVELAGGRGIGTALGVALRMDTHVADEALQQSGA